MEIYFFNSTIYRGEAPPTPETAYFLVPDKWDDFGYQTVFDAYLWLRGTSQYLGKVHLYFEGHQISRKVFQDLAPVADSQFSLVRFKHRFISLGSTLDYYKRLVRLLMREPSRKLLEQLHDVAILQALTIQIADLALTSDPVYETSFLRGMSQEQAQAFAASVILGMPRPGANSHFVMQMKLRGFTSEHTIAFDFRERLLPGNIIALIGANGLGKTQALVHLVRYLLRLIPFEEIQKRGLTPLEPIPRFRKILAMSLSPYSVFPKEAAVPAKSRVDYTRVGFYGEDGRFSLAALKKRSIEWLRKIVADDMQESIDDWKIRLTKLSRIAASLGIDELRIKTRDKESGVSITWPLQLKKTALRNLNAPSAKLLYYRHGKRIKLSSGQQQVFLMALALLAELENECIVLIDEPELYLHPNIEIEFLSLLNDLLNQFESQAILATHSNTIVRELPRTCVRVFRVADSTPIVQEPEFQTFGSDISEIANRVFDGVFVRHPFAEWLIREFGHLSFNQIMTRYGKFLNAESLAILYAHSKPNEVRSR